MNQKSIYIAFIGFLLTLILFAGCKKAEIKDYTSTFNVDTTSTFTDVTDTTSDEQFKLTEYDTPPIPVQNPMPEYPVKFRSSGIQGVVLLEVEVKSDGSVGDISVLKSLLANEGGLDATAKAAVKKWIFKPAMLNKKPVTSKVNIPIPFSLKD